MQYPERIEPLTWARFFAALAVVLHHYSRYVNTAPNPSGVAIGSLAVDFFFVLSGFVLAHVYGSRPATSWSATWMFLIARLSKIYPLHLLTLIFYVAIGAYAARGGLHISDPEKYDPAQIIPNVFLVHAWGFSDRGSFNYPSWSISAEWFAYMLFPAFVLLLSRRSIDARTWIVGVALWIVAVLAPRLIFGVDITELANDFGIYRVAPQFLIGVFLCSALKNDVSTKRPGLWLIALFACFAIARILVAPGFVFVLLIPALVVLLAELSRNETWNVLTQLRLAKFVAYLGEISFSMYMLHAPFATVCFGVLRARKVSVDVPEIAAVALILLIASAICYEFVEKPAQSIMKAFLSKLVRNRDARPI